MPAMPALRIASISSLYPGCGSPLQPVCSTHSSLPSVAITIHGAGDPEGCAIRRSSIAAIVPEVGACMGTLTKPRARQSSGPSALFRPLPPRDVRVRRCAGTVASPAPGECPHPRWECQRLAFVFRRVNAAVKVEDFSHAARSCDCSASVAIISTSRLTGSGSCQCQLCRDSSSRNHVDAIDRAGLHAQVTAGALAGDNRVHLLGRPEDRVHRAGLDALGAADALVLADIGHRCDLFLTVFLVQWNDLQIQQVRQGLDARLPPGGIC